MSITLEQQKANRKLWVEALRSGKYEQTRHTLRTADGFCCLGVLADIAGCEWSIDTGHYLADGCMRTAPNIARLFVGLADDEGNYPVDEDDEVNSLASLNDAGTPFAQIADIIESEPKGLFRP